MRATAAEGRVGAFYFYFLNSGHIGFGTKEQKRAAHGGGKEWACGQCRKRHTFFTRTTRKKNEQNRHNSEEYGRI